MNIQEKNRITSSKIKKPKVIKYKKKIEKR